MNNFYDSKTFLPLLKTATTLGLAIALTACGGSSGKNKSNSTESNSNATNTVAVTSVDVNSVNIDADSNNPSGLATPNPSFTAGENGSLQISIPGIEHGGTIYKTLVKNLNTNFLTELPNAATTDGAFCKKIESSDIQTKYDIAVVLDTTGSMGSHASNFANKVVSFAEALKEEANLDVKFAGITYGDAYATLNSDTDYDNEREAKGTLGTPPSFDYDERPDTGLDLLSPEQIQSFFSEVASNVSGGIGGGDGPENSLGPIYYQNTNVHFRDDAARMYIVIGDDCGHTPDSLTETGFDSSSTDHANWVLPSVENIEQSLRLSGAAVHLIWDDYEYNSSYCRNYYYAMNDLRLSTGGIYAKLDSNLDLSSLPLIEAVGEKRELVSCSIPKSASKGTKGYKLTFDLVIPEINAKWTVAAILQFK